MTVVTTIFGNNSDLLLAAGGLYIRDGDVVADVTYGKGVFWRQFDLSRITLLATDLHPIPPATKADFTKPIHKRGSLKVGVFDPPYCVPSNYEVLTPGGWVPLACLADGTPVAQFVAGDDPDQDRAEFVVPSCVIRQAYAGCVVKIGPSSLLKGKKSGLRGEGGTWFYTSDH